nr:polysaccharide biosynthesis/export family protein [Sinorhizobium fredii]
MLLGSPAKSGPPADDRLAPQDTVGISVSGWHTLLGGVVDAALLNDTFTIGTGGTLELPEIGRLPAAGLRESELAKPIADRLQARSGSNQGPATTVQRRTPAPRVPSSRVTTPAEGPPPAAQLRIAEPAATKQLQTLESEQSGCKSCLVTWRPLVWSLKRLAEKRVRLLATPRYGTIAASLPSANALPP